MGWYRRARMCCRSTLPWPSLARTHAQASTLLCPRASCWLWEWESASASLCCVRVAAAAAAAGGAALVGLSLFCLHCHFHLPASTTTHCGGKNVAIAAERKQRYYCRRQERPTDRPPHHRPSPIAHLVSRPPGWAAALRATANRSCCIPT